MCAFVESRVGARWCKWTYVLVTGGDDGDDACEAELLDGGVDGAVLLAAEGHVHDGLARVVPRRDLLHD